MESETSSSPESTTVSALHRSMTILRKELEMRNKQIANLEANLQRAMTPRTVDRNFNDIFELVEVVESDTDTHQRSSPASPTKSDKGTDKHFDPGTPTEDPIMAFVLSDEEERPSTQKHSSTTPPPFRRISLKMNEDIVIHTYNSNNPHQPPTRALSSSHLNPERPILQASHPHLPTTDSAIQTDITALKPRQWASEPLLVKRPLLGTRQVGKMDYAGRGRYSLLSRDFIPQKSNHRLNLYPPTFANDEQRSSSNFTMENSDWPVNSTLMEEDVWDSEIDSTDRLLFIAEEFVSTARRKLVHIQDWKAIHGRCCPQRIRTKASNNVNEKHHILSAFIPQKIQDLRLGYEVRFIYNTRLVNGTIRYLGNTGPGTNPWVGIETQDVIVASTDKAVTEWKSFFSCLKGGMGVLVKLEKIVLCFSA